MARPYVENVPDELYEALREWARSQRKSLSREVIEILRTFVPTPAGLAERRGFVQKALRLNARKPSSTGPFPSTEEMLREDRAR